MPKRFSEIDLLTLVKLHNLTGLCRGVKLSFCPYSPRYQDFQNFIVISDTTGSYLVHSAVVHAFIVSGTKDLGV